MDREREYGWIVLEDMRGAVALMYVEIDDQDLRPIRFGLKRTSCHSRIVEHAVTLSMIGECVMRAASKVDRNSINDGCLRCGNRRSDRTSRAFHKFW